MVIQGIIVYLARNHAGSDQLKIHIVSSQVNRVSTGYSLVSKVSSGYSDEYCSVSNYCGWYWSLTSTYTFMTSIFIKMYESIDQ